MTLVRVDVDDDLSVAIEPGGDDWAYSVTLTHGREEVTQYGSNFEPWGRAGKHILGNIVARRVDGYDSRERVGQLLEEAFAGREAELADAVDAD